MVETENTFRELFLNQTIKDIKFYHTSDEYIEFEPYQKWVVQGGVEFVFENQIVSFGWNAPMQLFDMQIGDIDNLVEHVDVYELDFSENPFIIDIREKKIEEINFSWNWYQQMDENLEIIDEKIYIPQEIKIKFEGEILMQIATVAFKLLDKQIHNPVYDSQSMMLVTINQPVEISEPEL